MGTLRPIPTAGEVFADDRGEGRTMRVSLHPGRGLVVVSLWAGRICRGSFRLPVTELPRLQLLLAQVEGWTSEDAGDASSDAPDSASAAVPDPASAAVPDDRSSDDLSPGGPSPGEPSPDAPSPGGRLPDEPSPAGMVPPGAEPPPGRGARHPQAS